MVKHFNNIYQSRFRNDPKYKEEFDALINLVTVYQDSERKHREELKQKGDSEHFRKMVAQEKILWGRERLIITRFNDLLLKINTELLEKQIKKEKKEA